MTRGLREAGFTLLELLVVIVVMSLMLGLLPLVTVGLERARLRAAADGLAIRLEDYQQTATETGRTVDVAFDQGRKRYGILGGTMRPIAPVVRRVSISSVPGAPECPAEIEFFADGGASGCRIRLTSAHAAETVSIDWLTGTVRRGD